MKTLDMADLFCGAGGTSQGAMEAVEAMGMKPRLTAINHWDIAIATHSANHPSARHLCTSLDNINPRDLFKPGELKLLWASPECTHHSVARGGKPIQDQSRATAWCVVRWAEALLPSVILVENVPEFVTWGALDAKGRPLKSKKGEIFRAWVNTLESFGYRVDWRVLCAADYGDPTTRRRLFVYAVRGRRKIIWPEPTHAPLADVDLVSSRKPWVPAREIIDWKLDSQSIFERKRPLSDKTLRRIEIGLQKFGFASFILPHEGVHGGNQPRSPEDPLNTITASHGAGRLVQPFLIKFRGNSNALATSNPVPTITANGTHLGLAEPYLVQVAHGDGNEKNGSTRRSRSLLRPMPTICGQRGEWAICQPFIVPAQSGGTQRPVTDPVPTITTTSRGVGLVQPFLIAIDHTGGNGHQVRPLSKPLSSVTTEARHALAQPFLVKYYGTADASSVDKPIDTVTAKSRFGLVRPMLVIDGEKYLLDIRFRMLQPHELAAAQGFKSDYVFTGNKTEQVRQIGNAVPRNLARALVLAALSQRSDITPFLENAEEKIIRLKKEAA